jgi:hypothetical protein
MARPVIVERTEEQVIARSTDRVFGAVFRETPAIPASYAGKYALLCVMAIDIQASEAQMDAFQTQVEAISNVHKAFVLSGPHRIPTNRVPADHDLTIGTEASFRIKSTPVVE